MHIAIIGTGYVGLVTRACLADFGHIVNCVDNSAERVEALGRFEIPFYEPALAELVSAFYSSGRDMAGRSPAAPTHALRTGVESPVH